MVRKLICGLAAACGISAAQQPVSIVTGDLFACFSHVEGNVQSSRVNVTGQPFTQALHIKTVQTGADAWNSRVRCFDTRPVRKNDTILATFWMRTTAAPAGTGLTTFVSEMGANPWTKSASVTVNAGSDWKKMEIPFSMLSDFGTGTMAGGANTYNLSFWVNYPGQEIEIGGFSVADYGTNYSYWNLGLTNWPYDGHAPDAPWRKTAADRIEKIRKADIAVVVRDDQGNALPGAPVHVKMKRHAFGFGSAIDGWKLTSTNPATIPLADQQKYRDYILKMFNKAVLENNLKWPSWESDRASALAALKWLRDNGITDVRGHNLIWPGTAQWYLPDDVRQALLAGNVDGAWLRKRINDHFTDILTATGGQLAEWDVVNEAVANHAVQDVLGNQEMVAWFKLAHQLDPEAKLFLNDYNIVAAGGMDLDHQNRYYDIIKFLIDNGAPLDGIGVQSHFDLNLTPPERVWEVLDRFGQFGKAIEVTEFDVNTPDERLKADYLRDFLTATFSHPSITGFLMWGFWEGAHWAPDAALISRDWVEKDNYRVWMDLIYNQWWTDVQGQAGGDGVFRTRGFLGDYDVEANGQTVPFTVGTGDINYALAGKQQAGTIAADGGIVNAASFAKNAPVAPGEIIEIWGLHYGAPTTVLGTYDGTQLRRFGGDTRVFFDGTEAPLIHTMRWDQNPEVGRVAVVVPYSATGQTKIEVEYLGTKTPAVTVPVAAAAPGIFCYSGGAGQAVAVSIQPDGTQVINQQSPVRRGGYVEFFITGEGQTDPAGVDGKLPAYPNNPRPVLPLTVKIGGVESRDCAYDWVGQTFAGVTQINTCVPEGTPTGDAVPLEVWVGGVPAQSGVTLRVSE